MVRRSLAENVEDIWHMGITSVAKRLKPSRQLQISQSVPITIDDNSDSCLPN